MTQTRPNGAKVPTNSDEYQLTQDLAAMADSLNVIIKVSSKAERDALPAADGWTVFRLDLGVQEARHGDVWRRASDFMHAAGVETISWPVSTPNVTKTVALPPGFTNVPIVTATLSSNAGATALKTQIMAYNDGARTDRFIIKLATVDGTIIGSSYALDIAWQATQATSVSAAG